MATYSEFFHRITGHPPLRYQLRLRETEGPFRAVEIPTGLGKTEAVMVDWLHRRPTRRLAWVLPGRALTRQVTRVAKALVAAAGDPSIQVVELMGGSDDNDLTLPPDQRAILVGTQDLLVSRILNRGYARTPFRWPMDFGLLNNDTAWVFDEVQLLGDALATSAQMAAFRETFGTYGDCPSLWLSATFDTDWLRTVDFGSKTVVHIGLESEDEQDEIVLRRLSATKTLAAPGENCRTPKECAQFAVQEHREGTLTLIMVNTVERAREVYAELPATIDKVLLHSRFRPADRAQHLEKVLTSRRGIVVSTQVIEAGVDLDADLLLTDIAPWASLVQRFGRVNRYGDRSASRIYWIDRPLTSKKREIPSAPYAPEQLDEARNILQTLTSAAPRDLPRRPGHPPYSFVVRKADLLDLFDTTPDLAGNQIDVSRYVRCGEETDVFVAWRDWPAGRDPARKPPLNDRELCPVPLGKDLKDFIEKNDAWTWRYTRRGAWEKVNSNRLYPGMRLVVRASAGGYQPESGWLPGSKKPVAPVPLDQIVPDRGEQSHDGDPRSRRAVRQTLAEHTNEVCQALESLVQSLAAIVPEEESAALRSAARRHDWGKAHPVFQRTLHALDTEFVEAPEVLLAKSDSRKRHSRKFFRHELASALAMVAAGDTDLSAYLAAAHHGKVRVNIRSMPGEVGAQQREARVARGVWDQDALFAADLGGGDCVPQIQLDLGVTQFGANGTGRSWTDRVLQLLDQFGPFRLAYLELLLRSADETASAGGLQEGDEEQEENGEEEKKP